VSFSSAGALRLARREGGKGNHILGGFALREFRQPAKYRCTYTLWQGGKRSGKLIQTRSLSPWNKGCFDDDP